MCLNAKSLSLSGTRRADLDPFRVAWRHPDASALSFHMPLVPHAGLFGFGLPPFCATVPDSNSTLIGTTRTK